MPSRPKFLIVSNARTGSTWLETMLGELPDVEVDYEFKWAPKYPPAPIHMVIPHRDFSCSRALAGISATTPIVGSKLVLDPRPHTEEEYRDLSATIEKEIRIIHLRRSYTEVFFSITRRAFINILSDPEREVRSNLLTTLKKHTQNDMNKLEKPRVRRYIQPNACLDTLKILLNNDHWIRGIKEGREHFVELDYSEISERFQEIARFIGSNARTSAISSVLENQPTRKLPPIDPRELIENVEQVTTICNAFEDKRVLFRNMQYLSEFSRSAIAQIENGQMIVQPFRNPQKGKISAVVFVNTIVSREDLLTFVENGSPDTLDEVKTIAIIIYSSFRDPIEILKKNDYSRYLEKGVIQCWHQSEWKEKLKIALVEILAPALSEVLVFGNSFDPLTAEVIKEIDHLMKICQPHNHVNQFGTIRNP